MKKTLNLWLVSEGVSEPRRDKINQHIDANEKLEVENWLMHMDGLIGTQWKRLCMEVNYDLDQLNIDDTAILTLDPDTGRKKYRLPIAMNGEKFGKWLHQNHEIIDYWVSLVKRAQPPKIEEA